MNIHVDTLEHAKILEQAEMARAHAEAIAQLNAKTVADLVDKELVTKDFLKGELAEMRAEFKSAFGEMRAEFKGELADLKAELRDEIRKSQNALEVQMRSMMFGGAIAAFVLSAVVLMTRFIK